MLDPDRLIEIGVSRRTASAISRDPWMQDVFGRFNSVADLRAAMLNPDRSSFSSLSDNELLRVLGLGKIGLAEIHQALGITR